MALHQDVLDMLQRTSRTFVIPISRLPDGLQEAVGSAYLCLRAIDEIEDHSSLTATRKVRDLRSISQFLQAQTSLDEFVREDLAAMWSTHTGVLPEVTVRLGEWACAAPASIAPRIWDATATMADRMAQWISRGWKMHSRADLDQYTFAVAGAVGLLLCDIYAWFDGSHMDRTQAIRFGRGLQAVNLLRNHREDLARGVDFFPPEWNDARMDAYARQNLASVERYVRTLAPDLVAHFITIPLRLAVATLDHLAQGHTKLSRAAVLRLTQLGTE